MLAPSAAVFSLLLVVTGVMKMAQPRNVERAISALGLPKIPGLGVGIGAAEVAIGALALVLPQALIGQAALYLTFAVWVFLALRASVPISSCGCLGRDDTPPTVAHLMLNLLAATLSLGAAAGALFSVTADMAGLAMVFVVGAGLFLSIVILTDAARLVGIRAK